jgi:polysaccharide biosynthesis/export protein
MKIRVLILCLCVILTACAKSSPLGPNPKLARGGLSTSNVEITQSDQMPVPERADLFERNRPYLIGPFDKLLIDVFGIDELSHKEVQTDAGGRISFPLAGIIESAGKTPAELEQVIEERLRNRFVRNPQVTVNLKETVSQVITVDGQVKEPGLYPVIGRMTLMRAVATAKGVSELAKLDDVVIFRTVKGQKMAGLYNLKAIRRGTYDDPEVFANDVVVVGDSAGRKFLKDGLPIAGAMASLAAPLILLLRGR